MRLCKVYGLADAHDPDPLWQELLESMCPGWKSEGALHRKYWEWGLGLYGLHKLGFIRPDAVALGVGAGVEWPLFYLAIPPAVFGLVTEQLGKADCTKSARVMIEKPFGRDLASAKELNRILLSVFDESGALRDQAYLPRIDKFLKELVWMARTLRHGREHIVLE